MKIYLTKEVTNIVEVEYEIPDDLEDELIAKSIDNNDMGLEDIIYEHGEFIDEATLDTTYSNVLSLDINNKRYNFY